jgi:hypothetical protein
MPQAFRAVCECSAIAAVLAVAAPAEARQQVAIDLAGAWVGFADDGVVSEALVGGSARWHLSPKISIGPELIYIAGDNHSHFVATGNLTVEFNPDGSVLPFFVVGGGVFQTRDTFFGTAVSSSEGAFTVGGGVRGRVTDRVSVGLDARVGWEPHLRIGAVVAIRLGR